MSLLGDEPKPAQRIAMLEAQLEDAHREVDSYRGALIALRDEVLGLEVEGAVNGAVMALVEGTLNVWRAGYLRTARPKLVGAIEVPVDWTALPGVTALADMLRQLSTEVTELRRRTLASARVAVALAERDPLRNAQLLVKLRASVKDLEEAYGIDPEPGGRGAGSAPDDVG